MTITVKQALQIAAEAMTDPRTVARIYEGKPSRRLVRERVIEAAKKMKMPQPPPVVEVKK